MGPLPDGPTIVGLEPRAAVSKAVSPERHALRSSGTGEVDPAVVELAFGIGVDLLRSLTPSESSRTRAAVE